MLTARNTHVFKYLGSVLCVSSSLSISQDWKCMTVVQGPWGTRSLCVLAASLMRLITCSGPSESCGMAQTNDQNPEKACLSSVANLLGCFRENTYLLHADLITTIYCLLCSLQGCVSKYPQHSPGETITDIQGEIYTSSLLYLQIKSALLVYICCICNPHLFILLLDSRSFWRFCSRLFLRATTSSDCLFLPSLSLQLSSVDIERFFSCTEADYVSCCALCTDGLFGAVISIISMWACRVFQGLFASFRVSRFVCCGLNRARLNLFKHLKHSQQRILFIITSNLPFS